MTSPALRDALAWAVEGAGGEIDIRTVSPTERAAKVNWLYIGALRFVSDTMSDDAIEALWQRTSKEHGVKLISVTVSRANSSDVSVPLADIASERKRQIEQEGWTIEHDDEHGSGDLAKAAACYALGHDTVSNMGGERIHIWPWEPWAWKPKDERRNLVKAGALIVAEIERIDRAAMLSASPQAKGDTDGSIS